MVVAGIRMTIALVALLWAYPKYWGVLKHRNVLMRRQGDNIDDTKANEVRKRMKIAEKLVKNTESA